MVCFRRAGVQKRRGELASKRAQGLGAHTPLPHAAHSLSLECPGQRNRHPSRRPAAERAREALKSVVCFRRAGVRKRRGELASKRAQGLGAHTPLPHAAHSLSLECPSQRNRHPSPRLAAERAREALKSVVCFRRAGVRKRRGELASKRAQGLGAHTPLPHAAHSLSLECPSQRNRHPSRRLAAERAREALKSVVCFRRAGVRKRRGELASSAPKASALTPRYPTRPTASASSAPAKETAIQAPGSPQNARGKL